MNYETMAPNNKLSIEIGETSNKISQYLGAFVYARLSPPAPTLESS